MKTLDASTADFRSIDDFWNTPLVQVEEDHVLADGPVLRFRWKRTGVYGRGPTDGFESLDLELGPLEVGNVYTVPVDAIQSEYWMTGPLRGEGSWAEALAGKVTVDALTDADVTVTVDLSADMVRTDTRGRFEERVRGTWRLPRAPCGGPTEPSFP